MAAKASGPPQAPMKATRSLGVSWSGSRPAWRRADRRTRRQGASVRDRGSERRSSSRTGRASATAHPRVAPRRRSGGRVCVCRLRREHWRAGREQRAGVRNGEGHRRPHDARHRRPRPCLLCDRAPRYSLQRLHAGGPAVGVDVRRGEEGDDHLHQGDADGARARDLLLTRERRRRARRRSSAARGGRLDEVTGCADACGRWRYTLAAVRSEDGTGWVRVMCDAPACRQVGEGRPEPGEQWPEGWAQDLRPMLADTGRARDYCPEHVGLASA